MDHLHREQDKKALILRLKRIEGQLRGLQRLIDADAPYRLVQSGRAASGPDKAFHSLVGGLIESRLSAKGSTPSGVKHALDILARYS
jgi:DNA-binding FrmR family transcriptional regulator